MPASSLKTARHVSAPERPIRLLVVDDSAVARAVFSRMVGDRPEFQLAAAVPGADAALAFLLHSTVDIILLDIEMPGRDGLTALPGLLEASRGARVLVVSSSADVGAAATLQALTLGAADTLAKPGAGAFNGRFADVLADRLLRIGHAPIEGDTVDRPSAPVLACRTRPLEHGRIACVAVGASTGGLHALSDLLRGIPASFGPPILITQHLPPSFMPIFASQIQDMSGRPTSVARPGMALVRGRILVAPGEGHLSIEMAGGIPRVRITSERVESGCLPSVDPMLSSIADAFGPAGVGVVLSGMGRDGLRGAERMAAIGADVLVQDRASSVVWGMPGAVATAGLASAILPAFKIADLLARRDRAAA